MASIFNEFFDAILNGKSMTCETSIKRDSIAEVQAHLNTFPSVRHIGRWVACECEACIDEHGTEYIHLEFFKHSEFEEGTKYLQIIHVFD